MELKPGYKQTEVGIIPEDWNCVQLPALMSQTSHSIKIGPFGSALKRELLTKEGYKVYGQENVYERNMTVGERFICAEHFRKLKSCEVKPGDFLISMMGTVGKCLVVPINIEAGIMDSHLLRLRLNPSKLDAEYLLQLFQTRIISNQVKQLSVGGIMEGLSSKIIKLLQFPVPEIEEQTAIAEALSDADALIESLEQLISKKHNIKQGAMQELLTGKKRLPGFETKPGYKQTEVGLIPEDWSVVPIVQVADKITVGFVGSMAHLFTNQGVPLLRGQNVLPNKLDMSETKFISNDTHKLWKKSALQHRDVIMVRVGYPGTACVIPVELGEANAASLVVVSPSTKKLDSQFLSLVINSDMGKRQIDSYLVGGAQQVLNTTTAAIFKLPLPTKSEQEAIATILSDMDSEIAALETKLAKARQIKQGMMQELLTGRIRLI